MTNQDMCPRTERESREPAGTAGSNGDGGPRRVPARFPGGVRLVALAGALFTTSFLSFPVVRAAAADRLQLPKVLVMVDERSLGSIPASEVQAMATSMLIDRRVPVVDQDVMKAGIAKIQNLMKTAGDLRAAAAVGMQFGADIMLMGEAVAKPGAQRIAESNLRTYQAVVTLRAVRTDNGEVVSSTTQDASVIGLDDVSGSSKALREAGRKALEDVIPRLVSGWRVPDTGGGAGAPAVIALTVGGMDQVWKLKATRDHLRGLEGKVRNVVQRQYTAGMATFDVETGLPAEEFAELLVLQPPQGLRLQILESQPGRISLRAVAAQ